MSRISPVSTETTSGKTTELFTAIKGQMGGVPNIFSTMAQSPETLEGFLNFSGALSQGVLTPALREQIALTVATQNECDYCASAHTVLGKGAGLKDEELEKSLSGNSDNPKSQAALKFSQAVVENRGGVSDEDLNSVRNAGYSDAEIIEIIAHVAINTFTNYFNRIAQTEIDFPVVSTANVSKAA